MIEAGVSRTEARELRRYRRFYLTYPQIRESVSPELAGLFQHLIATVEIRETATPEFELPANEIITKLSFSHFVEILIGTTHNFVDLVFYHRISNVTSYWN